VEKKIMVIVNGIAEKVPPGKTLSWLKELFEQKDSNMIAERNGVFVYPQHYDSVLIEEGDTIEFINPDFGG
jgi:thiamine biosynthesis protein ThiS